jgi:hypothetical protein
MPKDELFTHEGEPRAAVLGPQRSMEAQRLPNEAGENNSSPFKSTDTRVIEFPLWIVLDEPAYVATSRVAAKAYRKARKKPLRVHRTTISLTVPAAIRR